jgi:hypothetical protein
MLDRFEVGRALRRPLPRTEPVGDRSLVVTGFGEMLGQRLGLGLGPFGKAALERLRDLHVIAAARRVQQRLIGRFLDECVTEVVHGARRVTALGHELGADELVERGPSSRVGQADDRRQQLVVELASDDGRRLRDLLHGPEAIEPPGERVTQGRRDPMVRVLVVPPLERGLRDLLDVERNAFGALHDPVDHRGRQGPLARHLPDEARGLGASEVVQRE